MKNIHILPTSQCKGSFKDCFKSLDECVCDNMKQETLEEAAERLYPYELGYGVFDRNCEIDIQRERFVEGAKWQQERSYSEEDLHNTFWNGWLYRGEEKYKFQFPKAKKEWFEQFKKK